MIQCNASDHGKLTELLTLLNITAFEGNMNAYSVEHDKKNCVVLLTVLIITVCHTCVFELCRAFIVIQAIWVKEGTFLVSPSVSSGKRNFFR